ncbi:MAG: NAD(P)H-hydrate dehydratase [Hungatella sp.]|jgi:hydroxyethylthiazole kinase-like uncharacterized protein yjeF|nr:NAD(P)H-hydrate dehydratase [Hungatella sp.]
MRYLVTGEQMKAIDGYTIHTVGIPSLVLMERAAMAVAREAEARIKAGQHVWAVCGTGNNGADGVAAARMLALKGHSVTVIVAGAPNRGTKEFHVQKEIAERLKIPMVEWKDFLPGRCDLLIDALFGVGLTREIEGEYREIIEAVNGMNPQTVIAVDMPSGIHSTTGQVMGDAVKAHVTVTFGYGKLGTALYPGREYCGELVVEDIGFPDVSAKEAGPFAWTYGREDLHRMPARPACSNKGTFGKVLLIAGCSGMSGAAYLAGLAAYRAGAGLVKIMTVDQNRTILQQLLPEAVVTVYSPQEILPDGQEPETEKEPGERLCCSSAWEKRIEKECAWADVIVLGPGLGRETYAGMLVKSVLTSAYVPIVADADGLNAIASWPQLEQYYTENIIVTPHLGEMARLTGETVERIQSNIVDTALEYGSSRGIVCVLKDAATVVTNREGQCYINTSGNSCMAKAGSGDVLAGTIGGLLSQGMEPFDGAVLGVYLHGLAGDRYRTRCGEHGMLARELAEEIGRLRDGEE